MTILSHECPRCLTENIGFRHVAQTEIDPHGVAHAMFICPKCSGPILVRLLYKAGTKHVEGGDIRDSPNIRIEWVEPPAYVPKVPEHTPSAVARLYKEACENLHRKNTTSAAAVFRKCLEIALREFSPDIEAWKLEKRINKMAKDHLITPALQDWAHELRIDGNAALHSDDAPPLELVSHMEKLTYFLLIYLYSLPAQVNQARQTRQPLDS